MSTSNTFNTAAEVVESVWWKPSTWSEEQKRIVINTAFQAVVTILTAVTAKSLSSTPPTKPTDIAVKMARKA